jgi:3-oxoadipate enol-lactonase
MPATTGTFTATDNSTIAYRVEGAGTPLLLLPGQGSSMKWWDRVVPALAKDFTTVRFDYLGTGESAAVPDGLFTTRRFAADAARLLDELDIPRTHVFGTSMGGKVAQWLALDHPLRVDRLVLSCTMTGGSAAVGMSEETARRFTLPGQAGIEARLQLMYTDGFLATNEPNPALAQGPLNRQGILGHWKASTGHDTSDLAGNISNQTLLLHGEEDEVVPPENSELLARLIPNARLSTFPGLRHGFFDEDAVATTRAVADFLL